MKVKVCVLTFWAILMAVASASAGCARVDAVKAMATATPISGAEDPEQPFRPSDYSGMIVSVTHERISIQPGARLGGENGAAFATVSSASAVGALEVPLASGVLIRQSRYIGENAELVNLLPYEIVPGLHAEVWLDSEGNAAYIRVSVRMHLEALA